MSSNSFTHHKSSGTSRFSCWIEEPIRPGYRESYTTSTTRNGENYFLSSSKKKKSPTGLVGAKFWPSMLMSRRNCLLSRLRLFRPVVSWVTGSIFFRIAIDYHVALFCSHWEEILHFPGFLGFQAESIVWSRLVNENFHIIVYFFYLTPYYWPFPPRVHTIFLRRGWRHLLKARNDGFTAYKTQTCYSL